MIKPILHRIIVKQDTLEDKDPAFASARALGIITETRERDREQAAIDTGKVISIGATAFEAFGAKECPIKVGDFVVYARYAGKTVIDPEDPDTKYVALNDEDVIAVTTEGA